MARLGIYLDCVIITQIQLHCEGPGGSDLHSVSLCALVSVHRDLFPEPIAVVLGGRAPSLVLAFRPSSVSNTPRSLPIPFFFLDELRCSNIPIFCGWFNFFAERIAAFSDLVSLSSLSASNANFLLFCFRVNPDSRSLLGYRVNFLS